MKIGDLVTVSLKKEFKDLDPEISSYIENSYKTIKLKIPVILIREMDTHFIIMNKNSKLNYLTKTRYHLEPFSM